VRTTKTVHNLQTGKRLMCCLPSMPGGDTCDRDGYDLFKVLMHDHARTIACASPLASHSWMIFCSERHRQLFITSHRTLGKLPPGYARTIL